MKEELVAAIAKSQESLQVARDLHQGGHHGFSVSRAYYAMFYLAEAALLTKGFAVSSHQAVISAFGQHFVKDGTFPKELHHSLARMFSLRLTGDYGDYQSVTAQQASASLSEAERFVSAVSAYVDKCLADQNRK